jgi:hypothetical protein
MRSAQLLQSKCYLITLCCILVLAVVTFAFLQPAGNTRAVSNFHVASNAHAAMHPHFMATKQQGLFASTRKRKPSNVLYYGGPIMPGIMQAYAIFWEPTGSYASPTYNSLITRYFGDVGSSPLYHNNTQYTDINGNCPSGADLAGSWVDTAPYPSSTLQDSDIQNEVINAMKANGWAADITHAFFVFTAKNEIICAGLLCSFSAGGFCGYHSAFGTNTIYAVIPYAGSDLYHCGVPSSPNRDFDADSTINVTSHEQMEVATDPFLNAWYDPTGPYPFEIGDKCRMRFGSTINGADVAWNNDPYIVQGEWDNARSACVLSGP